MKMKSKATWLTKPQFVKNQTDIRKVKRYAATVRTSSGFGVFLIKTDSGELEKQVIEGMSYRECCERGESAEAFKWVPATPRAIRILGNTAHGCGQRCSRTCPEPGCLCHDGRCK